MFAIHVASYAVAFMHACFASILDAMGESTFMIMLKQRITISVSDGCSLLTFNRC